MWSKGEFYYLVSLGVVLLIVTLWLGANRDYTGDDCY